MAVRNEAGTSGSTDRRSAMLDAYRSSWWKPSEDAYAAIFAAAGITVTDEVAEVVNRIGNMPAGEVARMLGRPCGTNFHTQGEQYWTAVANELFGK